MRLGSFYFLTPLLLLSLFASVLGAEDSYVEYRVIVGLKLFKTLVKSDLDLDKKLNDEQAVELLFVTSSGGVSVENIEGKPENIGNYPTAFKVLDIEDLFLNKRNVLDSASAIFIYQPLSDEDLRKLIQLCNTRKIILFSPFEGDVEAGVLSGLSVQSTIKPYINKTSLEQSQLNIKPFYLKVARFHE